MDRFVSRIARWCGALVALFLVGVCIAPQDAFRTTPAPHNTDVGQPLPDSATAAQREGARVRVSATQTNLRRLPAAVSTTSSTAVAQPAATAPAPGVAIPPSSVSRPAPESGQRVEPVADSTAPATESREPNSKNAPAKGHEPSLAPLEPEPQPAVYTTGDGRRLADAADGASLRSILVVPGGSLALPTTLAPSAQPSLPAVTGTIIHNPIAPGLQVTRISSPNAAPQPAPALALTPPQNPATGRPPVAQPAPSAALPESPQLEAQDESQEDSPQDSHDDSQDAAQQVLPDDVVDEGSPDAETPATETLDAADDQASVISGGPRAVAAQPSTGVPAPLMVTNQWVEDEAKPKSNPVQHVAPTSSKAPLEPPMPAAPPASAAPPPVPGDLPIDVQRRVQQEMTTGFSLAERGAVFSAQARFLQALTWIAQSHDQRGGSGRHTQAMQQGLQALDEIKDLVGLAANSTGGTDLAHVVHYHRTRVVSESELSKLTPQMLAERYREFARQQLVAATGRSSTASKTLFGLAKLQSVLQSPGAQDANLRDARAQAFYQAALDADANNFPAANELGVLLSRQGRPEEALAVLRQAARVGGGQPQVWHNLAAVHRQLGQSDQAQLAEAEKQKLQGGQGGRAGTTLPPVTWVSPDQFAANSPPEGQWARSAASAPNDNTARDASSTASTANSTAPKETNQAKGTQSGSSGRSLSQRWNPWRRAPQSESNDATRWR